MSFVAILPEVLSFEMLCLWCGKKDLVKLDSAFCNVSDRDFLTRLTQWKLFTLPVSECMSEDLLSWLEIKQIRVSNLKVNGRHILQMAGMAAIYKRFKKEPPVNKIYNIDYSKYINSCVDLKSLEITDVSGFTDEVVLNINPTLLEQISTLVICFYHGSRNSPQFTNKGIQYLATHCRKLEKLSLRMNFTNFGVTEEDVVSLVRVNPLLTSISIDGDDCFTNHLFNTISESCPLLTTLSVEHANTATVQSFTNVLTKCPKIEKMYVSLDTQTCWFKYTAPGGQKSTNKEMNCFGLEIRELKEGIPLNDWFISRVAGFHTISMSYPYDGGKALTDFTLHTLADSNPNLQSFRASFCVRFSSDALQYLLRKCRILHTLMLADITSFIGTHDEMVAVFSVRNVLSTIVFDRLAVNTEIVVEIVRLCSSTLKTFVIMDCEEVVIETVKQFVLDNHFDVEIWTEYPAEMLMN